MVEKKVPITDDNAGDEKLEMKESEIVSEVKDAPVKEKVTKAKKATKKVAKKAAKIEPEKKQKMDKAEKKSIWQKIKGIFGK